MTDIASHCRIFDLSPSDDLVAKRTAAISDLEAQFKKRATYEDILNLAGALATALMTKGRLPEDIGRQVEGAIKSHSPAYVWDGHELEGSVCAVSAAIQYLEGSQGGAGAPTRADVLALGLWSVLSFQKALSDTKLERLRVEALRRSRELAMQSAASSRRRIAVLEAPFAVTEAEGWAAIEKKWKAGPLKAIDTLRRNAALDREEIDILWWALSDWSEVFERRFSGLDSHVAALAGALELSKLLKRIPSEAHKHLVLRLVGTGGDESLAECLLGLGEQREALASVYAENPLLVSCPSVFPLLCNLTARSARSEGDKIKRAPSDWAARALLEGAILQISTLEDPIS